MGEHSYTQQKASPAVARRLVVNDLAGSDLFISGRQLVIQLDCGD